MAFATKASLRFDWVDGLKAFAIIGILLNHFVEEFGEGPWFSNPSYNWPSFSERISSILPEGSNWFIIGIKFLGWLGDMGPGVFILLSGFTLTLSQLKNEKSTLDFFRSRIIRIFPLYLVIHFIVIVFIILVNYPVGFKVFSPWVSLSFLGLRFTDSLFFFINPSWWFIWLIIQLYLFFPWLFQLLKRKSLFYFISITLIITVLSRLAGLLHLTYSNNLYYWMTGLFAGTRLFEFTAGMVLAKLITERSDVQKDISIKPYILFLTFLIIYVFGFFSSWTYVGSLISNILITIGLSGIFYGCYNLISQIKPIRNNILFIGRNSFSVFLIHQPFMQFAADKLQGIPKIVYLLIIILLAFPIGYLVEKLVNYLVDNFFQHYNKIEKLILSRASVFLIYLLTFGLIVFNTVLVIFSSDIIKFNILFSVFYLIILGSYLFAFYTRLNKFIPSEFLLFSVSVFAYLFILPPDWMPVISITLLLVFILFRAFNLVTNSLTTFIFTFLLTTGILIGAEQLLRIKKPIETGRWGELPALQTDSNTAYSLIANKTTHLRYNNYNYTLKTNSLGFTSPEIDLRKEDPQIFRVLILGDAFSMPEGMDYSSSYPYLLESELKKKLENRVVQVINGGVTGYGPNEMLAQLKFYIDTIKPDLIINELFINEFEEVNLNALSRLKNIGFLTEESTRLKLFGYSQLMLNYRLWLRDILGYEDKQYNYNKSLLYLYEKSSELYSDTVINKLDNYLDEIKSLSDSKGAKLWLVYVPGQIEVSPSEFISYYPDHVNLADSNRFDFNASHKIINSLCNKHSIYLLDSKEILKNYPTQPVYFEDSWHWNPTGHLIIAKMLAKEIESSFNSTLPK